METQEQVQTVPATTSGILLSFRLSGVPVRLHFTFVLALIYLLVTGLSGKQSVINYLVFVTALFGSVLAHEFGHAFVAARYGVETLEIVMFPIGGVARMARALQPAEDLWTAFAGPVVNLSIAGILFAFRGQLFNIAELREPTDSNLLSRILLANIVLALFNMIPAFPMDGGRMLRAILARWKNEDEATRIAAWAGRMLAISMGLYGLLAGGAHPGAEPYQYLLVFAAFFVYQGSAHEGAAAMGRSLSHGIPVRAAMLREVRTLSHGDTIRDAADLLLATGQQDFPVVHNDEVVGLLSRNTLLRGLAVEGAESYVAGLMEREFLAIEPQTDLAEVLPVLAQAGTCALVMEGDKLLGMLTTENVSQFLLLRRLGMEPVEPQSIL